MWNIFHQIGDNVGRDESDSTKKGINHNKISSIKPVINYEQIPKLDWRKQRLERIFFAEEGFKDIS